MTIAPVDHTALILAAMKDWVVPIISSIIGGILAMVGAVWAVRKTSRSLELDEIRRSRVECLSNLIGLRYTITKSILSQDDRSRRSFELNRIPILWSDDQAVLEAVREFHAAQTETRLIAIIRAMGRNSKFPVENLTDTDLSNIFQ
jgi:uncharacterized membrane protein